MATIRRFEDLGCWQKARKLANAIPEFIRFLKMSRRSASEIRSELYLALDRRYKTQEQLDAAYKLATEAKQLFNAFIAFFRKNKPPSPL